jgi:Rrf2 family protein
LTIEVGKFSDLEGQDYKMLIPHKRGQYALRAIYELAKHMGEGPIKISDIASAQAIPRRFLEVILNQLKGSGIVKSKRGFYGGYVLARQPDQVTVGDVFRFLQKDQEGSSCIACVTQKACPFFEQCAFSNLWHQVKAAAFNIYDKTTMQDLLESNKAIGAGVN